MTTTPTELRESVWALAVNIHNQWPGVLDQEAESLTEEELQAYYKLSDALDLASFEVAEACDFDLELIRSVTAWRRDERRGVHTVADNLLRHAGWLIERSYEPDEERAAHLARMVDAGMPGCHKSFAPRHVRRAIELAETVDARLWLIDFESRAAALV